MVPLLCIAASVPTLIGGDVFVVDVGRVRSRCGARIVFNIAGQLIIDTCFFLFIFLVVPPLYVSEIISATQRIVIQFALHLRCPGLTENLEPLEARNLRERLCVLFPEVDPYREYQVAIQFMACHKRQSLPWPKVIPLLQQQAAGLAT